MCGVCTERTNFDRASKEKGMTDWMALSDCAIIVGLICNFRFGGRGHGLMDAFLRSFDLVFEHAPFNCPGDVCETDMSNEQLQPIRIQETVFQPLQSRYCTKNISREPQTLKS